MRRSYAVLLFLAVLAVVVFVELVMVPATVDQVDQVGAAKSGPARRRRAGISTGYWKSDDRRSMRGDVEPRTVRVNVCVTPAERERWKALALAESMSVSEFVRHAVNEWTPSLPGLPTVPSC